MYYLAKFCRICIKSDVKLMDIDTVDLDSVSLSAKLAYCTKMMISRESLSTEICEHCVNKLRISYEFHTMCKQSTKKLQGYLSELISTSAKVNPSSFVNSDLRVSLSPLGKPTFRRKRITKEQRCSLLKSLLSQRALNKKQRRKRRPRRKKEPPVAPRRRPAPASVGCLRKIIDFTAGYDFGCARDADHSDCVEPTPLARLATFTDTFFANNFADFSNTILYLIESKDNCSGSDDDDDMFDCFPAELGEEVLVEPDIKIKTEDFDDCEHFPCNYYVETSYSDTECKKENVEEQGNAMLMLDQLVGAMGPQRRAFSHNSVRCRTRDSPYINPKLKQQFQLKSFQCDKCNRYFKSPGYLKAHMSKIHS